KKVLLYCPDARPARATFAFTQALNHRWVSTDRDYGVRRAQIPPPPHRLEVALHAVHADRQAVLQGEILRMLGEHRSENAWENFSGLAGAPPIRLPALLDKELHAATSHVRANESGLGPRRSLTGCNSE